MGTSYILDYSEEELKKYIRDKAQARVKKKIQQQPLFNKKK